MEKQLRNAKMSGGGERKVSKEGRRNGERREERTLMEMKGGKGEERKMDEGWKQEKVNKKGRRKESKQEEYDEKRIRKRASLRREREKESEKAETTREDGGMVKTEKNERRREEKI